MSSKPARDQRRYPRIPFKKAVKFRGTAGEFVPGHLALDISQGGLKVNSATFLPVGSPIEVQVQLEDESRVLDISAKIAWVKYLPNLEAYQMGLEFAGDTVFAQWKITQFVYKAQ